MATYKLSTLFNCFIPLVIIFIIKSFSSAANRPKSPKTPHILFLLVDDLGWTDISQHGSEYKTANIDNLMSTGIELTNYYVHLDCSPTRSALMTGQYSFKNGLQNIRTIRAGTEEHIPFQNPTIPELLQKVHYSSHMLGKWHLGYAAWNMTPTGRGFNTHYGYLQGAEDYYNHTLGNGFDFWRNQQVEKNVVGYYSTQLYDNYVTKLLADYNKTAEKEPLFIYMAFQTVHTPIEISPNQYKECENLKSANRSIYCNKIQYLDNVIGNMISLFKVYDLWNDTVLLFSTDNGGMPYWSDNANYLAVSWGCNMPYRAGKATLFQGGVHGVGFINGGNNIIPNNLRGTQSNIMTHVIDWLPTIIKGIIGEELPDGVPFDGINMWDALMNPRDKSLWNRTTLYIDIENNGTFAGIIDNDYKYFQGQQLYTSYFPCNGSYIPYDNSSDTVTEWLFNLKQDPYELTNIASQHKDLVNKYQDMIVDFINNDGYMQEQSDTFHIEASPEYHDGVWAPWLG